LFKEGQQARSNLARPLQVFPSLTIFGTPEQAQAQLNRWHQIADYMTPALMLQPNLGDEQINFVLEALKPV
jgi:alkanesulfonate monooxygenase SsuD/methylene tetrahydromethanopterin reductase-like flavin-dependent oxidoreductase (luciferase family)